MDNMSRTLLIDVGQELVDERIDKALTEYLEGKYSRSFIQKVLKEGNVSVDGKVAKASLKLKEDMQIAMLLPELREPDITPENIPISVLYEDEDVLVVNKPKGMVVHPAAGHFSGTLVNAIMFHCKGQLSGINGVLRPGIVHRIDRDTTGSLIVCKNDKAHNFIAQQLKEHSIDRRYRAIVVGNLKDEEGTIDAPLGRDKKDRKKMAITADGKRAVTHYKVLKRMGQYSYIECKLETGRTHQIRVHMASIGHPLLGDEVYGKPSAKFNLQGQCLHAMTLGFIHPASKEYVEVCAPLPDYFLHLLEVLK